MLRRRALVEAIEVDGARVTGVRYSAATPRHATDIQAGRRAREDRLTRGRRGGGRRPLARARPASSPRPCGARPRSPAWRGSEASPIVSVELWLDRVVVDTCSMVGLRDCEVEWVFDKGRLFGRAGAPQHLAFIVSAAYRSSPKPNAELLRRGRRPRCAATSRRWPERRSRAPW